MAQSASSSAARTVAIRDLAILPTSPCVPIAPTATEIRAIGLIANFSYRIERPRPSSAQLYRKMTRYGGGINDTQGGASYTEYPVSVSSIRYCGCRYGYGIPDTRYCGHSAAYTPQAGSQADRRGQGLISRPPFHEWCRPPSSSGLGLRPFKAATGIRIPLGARRSWLRCDDMRRVMGAW